MLSLYIYFYSISIRIYRVTRNSMSGRGGRTVSIDRKQNECVGLARPKPKVKKAAGTEDTCTALYLNDISHQKMRRIWICPSHFRCGRHRAT